MVSDDTEHACLVAQALLASGGDLVSFRQHFGRVLVRWLWSLPAGLGRATLTACVRLSLGWSPQESGVPSAGNAPAMRAALLGVIASDFKSLQRLVQVATRITHTDPRAELGALAVAIAAREFSRKNLDKPIDALAQADTIEQGLSWWLEDHQELAPTRQACQSRRRHIDPQEAVGQLQRLLQQAGQSAQSGQIPQEFAASQGLARGVSGYVYETVPVALQAAWVFADDFSRAVSGAIQCGGDADTVGAITGAVVGSRVGKAGLPPRWLAGLNEWPRTVKWMEGLANQLAEAFPRAAGLPVAPSSVPSLPAIPLVARNLLFLALVLGWGVRRLLPPF